MGVGRASADIRAGNGLTASLPTLKFKDFEGPGFGINLASVAGEEKKMLITSVNDRKRLSLLVIVLQAVGCVLLFSAVNVLAQNEPRDSAASKPAPTLVVGFVGGFVHRNDLRHSEVQLARHLQATYGDDIHVQVFRNRERALAHKFVLEWVNGLTTGSLMSGNRAEARIILFGHSWGASAVVYLARELERDGIPVTLTIQVDSVRKDGQDDSVIPANVAEAVNFYQTKGLIHGRSKIIAADPARTALLGNFRSEYQKEPAECHAYPWYDRLFFKGHTSIECDPRVWSQVETLIEARIAPPLQPAQTKVAAQAISRSPR